jgi:CO/xanthine dehydrogenase Mo-binding subunit
VTERGGAVGQSWPRADAEAKVRGTFRYTADEPVGRCCYVGVHRASRPHARIRSVSTDAARDVPGVVAVVTGADLYQALGDRLLTGPAFADQPALAVGRVRYAGEPVAAVLAWDQASARSAAGLVRVRYQDLPAVHDVDAAAASGPYVHPALRPSAVFGDLAHLSGRTGTNVNYTYRLRPGTRRPPPPRRPSPCPGTSGHRPRTTSPSSCRARRPGRRTAGWSC